MAMGGRTQNLPAKSGAHAPKKKQEKALFREFQDRFQDDPAYLGRLGNLTKEEQERAEAASAHSARSGSPGRRGPAAAGKGGQRKAWDAGSRHSSMVNASQTRAFNAKR